MMHSNLHIDLKTLTQFIVKHSLNIACLLFFCSLMFIQPAHAERLKDLATIQGVRNNQLLGYGLVVGLDGTGDSNPYTIQSTISMMQQMGISLPAGTSVQMKNVASVMITSSLPAFAQPGQTLDVTVSSMGSAKSLRGGTLLMTPIKGCLLYTSPSPRDS